MNSHGEQDVSGIQFERLTFFSDTVFAANVDHRVVVPRKLKRRLDGAA